MREVEEIICFSFIPKITVSCAEIFRYTWNFQTDDVMECGTKGRIQAAVLNNLTKIVNGCSNDDICGAL